jgi:hypothetical protein
MGLFHFLNNNNMAIIRCFFNYKVEKKVISLSCPSLGRANNRVSTQRDKEITQRNEFNIYSNSMRNLIRFERLANSTNQLFLFKVHKTDLQKYLEYAS